MSRATKRFKKLNPSFVKTLSELIKDYPVININGVNNRDVNSICYDSRKGVPGSLFVAIRGARYNGEHFIKQAVDKGASIVVSESPYSPKKFPYCKNLTYVQVECCREALSSIASRFYEEPSNKLKLFGITGTNGKTTVAYILESIFQNQGKLTGVVGTINSRYSGITQTSSMTTPESLDLNCKLYEMVQNNVEYCFLEVSSHALALKRVENLRFETILFTNLTRDHLDFHTTFQDYKETKKSLFKKYPKAKAVVNIDDPIGKEIFAESRSVDLLKIGLSDKADIKAVDIQLSPKETRWRLQTPWGQKVIRSKLLGVHNIYNQLAAAAGALSQKISLETITNGLESINKVPGRFEPLEKGQPFTVIVDYAHTEDALTKVLQSCKAITKNKIILVFGCGGDRDRGKRLGMGKAAINGSNYAIVTSDNPRTEDPEKIIDDICKGFLGHKQTKKDHMRIADRGKAIQHAIAIAQPGDLVLITGKGHENYQIVSSSSIPFDDRALATAAIEKRFNR